jgi:hypothetical protein
LNHGNDFVVGIIERRPDEIIHGCIHHQKTLAIVFLSVNNRSDQHSGRPHNRAARFEQQMHIQPAQRTGYCVRETHHILGELQSRFLIGNPQPTSGIDVIQRVPIGAQLTNKVGHSSHCFRERRDIRDL